MKRNSEMGETRGKRKARAGVGLGGEDPPPGGDEWACPEAQNTEWVGAHRIELWASFLSGRRSTTELRTRGVVGNFQD